MIIVVSYITVSKYGTRDFADVVKYLEMGYNPGGPIVIIQEVSENDGRIGSEGTLTLQCWL